MAYMECLGMFVFIPLICSLAHLSVKHVGCLKVNRPRSSGSWKSRPDTILISRQLFKINGLRLYSMPLKRVHGHGHIMN